MALDRQQLWNIKHPALQAEWFPSSAQPYYRNNDGTPHEHNGSYHITIDWRWEDQEGRWWQKTCHVMINRKTGKPEDTEWFRTMPIPGNH